MSYRPPEEVIPGLFRIRLPQPILGGVYVHLAIGGSGPVTLIDSGLPHPLTQSALIEQLRTLNLELKNIEQIVYTHSHIDHMGGGYLIGTDHPGIKHVAHTDCIDLCEDFPVFMQQAISWALLEKHLAYVPEIADALSRENMGLAQYISFDQGRPLVFSRGLREGDRFDAGPYTWRVYETPGHNPHHLVFLDESTGTLIGGDVILDHGTPIMRGMGDDVGVYLQSLNKLRHVPFERVLTSHGPYFKDGHAELERTISERLTLLEWLWARIREPRRLWDLALAAAQDPALTNRQQIPLVMGIFESALFIWSQAGLVRLDETTGNFHMIRDLPVSAEYPTRLLRAG